MAEEKAYFKLLIDIYEINVSWSCRKDGQIKQASHMWSRTTPPWMSKLSPSATASTGRVRARFNPVSCRPCSLWETPGRDRHTGLGNWLWPRLKVELRRQQPGESSPAWSFWSDMNCWQQLSSPQSGWDMGYIRAVLTAGCTSPSYSLSLLWQPRPGEQGELQPCPLRHPALAVSGRKPLRRLRGEGAMPA